MGQRVPDRRERRFLHGPGLLFTVAAASQPDHRELRCRASVCCLPRRQCSQSRRHISFPQPSVSHVDHALVYVDDGELWFVDASAMLGERSCADAAEFSQDPSSQAWTLNFASTGSSIQELTIPGGGNLMVLFLHRLLAAPCPWPFCRGAGFLCSRDGHHDRGRAGGRVFLQTGANGDPIVEFAYFQNASGPHVQGTAKRLRPRYADPYPQLERNCSSAGQPASASPLAGALTDLHTYTQWSWPLDGAPRPITATTSTWSSWRATSTRSTQLSRAIRRSFAAFPVRGRNNNHTLLVPTPFTCLPSTAGRAGRGAKLCRCPRTFRRRRFPFHGGASTRSSRRCWRSARRSGPSQRARCIGSGLRAALAFFTSPGGQSQRAQCGLAIQQSAPGWLGRSSTR